MFLKKKAGKNLLVGLFVVAFLSSCASDPEALQGAQSRMAKLSSSGSGTFNGTWNVKLKASKDSCGLGLVGKTQPATVVIAQNGNKIKLSISGLPKAFSGTVRGNSASASGTYSTSGISLRGSVAASKQSSRKIKISSAVLNLSGNGQKCSMTFAGSGSKA